MTNRVHSNKSIAIDQLRPTLARLGLKPGEYVNAIRRNADVDAIVRDCVGADDDTIRIARKYLPLGRYQGFTDELRRSGAR